MLQSKLNKIKASERRQEKALAWRLPDGLLDQLRENQSREHAATDHYQGGCVVFCCVLKILFFWIP